MTQLDIPAAPPNCTICALPLREGQVAWAAEWTVVTPLGLRRETRYTCDPCEQRKKP